MIDDKMTINQWASRIYECGMCWGWWGNPRNPPLQLHMLMVEKIAEASKAYMNDELEEEAAKLVDCLIRILDYMEYRRRQAVADDNENPEHWNVHQILRAKHRYNKTRPYRHGGKKA